MWPSKLLLSNYSCKLLMTFFRAIHFSEVIERYSSSLLDNLFIICGLVNLLSWTDIIITINNRWYNTFISVVRLRWSFYCLGPCVFCRHKVSQTLLRACFRGISGGKILVLSIHSNRMQSSHCSRGTQRSHYSNHLCWEILDVAGN